MVDFLTLSETQLISSSQTFCAKTVVHKAALTTVTLADVTSDWPATQTVIAHS